MRCKSHGIHQEPVRAGPGKVVLGTLGGGFGVQQGKTAPGYVIAEVEVTDAAAMQKYGEKVRIWRANGRR